jgi:hypothetical protein
VAGLAFTRGARSLMPPEKASTHRKLAVVRHWSRLYAHSPHEMAWHLGVEQAAALLIHRCQIIAYDDDIDEIALRAGGPQACLPILRYLFTRFSEALAETCEAAGCLFSPEMTDAELIDGIIRVWPTISPDDPSLGDVTVAKILQPNAWGISRLLFTLQCVLVCCRAHDRAVARQDAEWLDGIEWTNTSPQQQFDQHRADPGSESQQVRSAVAWMAEAYREQLESVGEPFRTLAPPATQIPAQFKGLPEVAKVYKDLWPGPLDEEPEESSIDAGAAEQAAWLERLRKRDAGESDRSASSSLRTLAPMLMTNPTGGLGAVQSQPEMVSLFADAEALDARVVYSEQCERAGLPRLAALAVTLGLAEPLCEGEMADDAEVVAIMYRGAMAQTQFPVEPSGVGTREHAPDLI